MCTECRPYSDGFHTQIYLEEPTMDTLVAAVEEELADLQEELNRLKTLRDQGAWVDGTTSDRRGVEYYYTVLDPELGCALDMDNYDDEPCDQYAHAIQELDKPIDEGGTCVA